MKSTLHILYIGLILTIFSCGQSSNDKLNTDNNLNNKKDTLPLLPNRKFDYIVFGLFCGECGGECATMYKFDVLNNQLFVDHTDSYWEHRKGKDLRFETEIQNTMKINLAKQIIDSIPETIISTKRNSETFGCPDCISETIISTKKNSETFGCPDCTDGCGIYLETKQDITVRMFYIDYQTNQLIGEIKTFSEYLKRVIGKM